MENYETIITPLSFDEEHALAPVLEPGQQEAEAVYKGIKPSTIPALLVAGIAAYALLS